MQQDQKPPTPDSPGRAWKAGPILWAILIALLINGLLLPRRLTENVAYSDFLRMLDQGQVAQVAVSNSEIVGETKPDAKGAKRDFVTVRVDDDRLIDKLTAKGVKFRGLGRGTFWDSAVGWIFTFIFIYLMWSFISRRTANLSQGGLFGLTKSRARIFAERDIKTTFADVAGVEEAKEELKEIVSFLKEREKYLRLGGRAPKGILLVGPPGTGKTLLARALAGEAKVPFFSINGSEFVEMFVGLGAARVRDLFEQGRKQAPCILFIDEVDAMGKSRAFGLTSAGPNDEKEQTLNQLLAEMDGFDSSEGVIVLAATNRPEILDPALMRAGRFDRQVTVGNPDHAGRVQILRVHTKKIKLDPLVNLDHVASLTSGFSGADLANLVNEAAFVAVRRNATSVNESDFTKAIERIVAGLEHKTKVMNPDEKRRVAFHEMGHTTVNFALNVPDKIHKVSIVPRGMGSLGHTMQRPTEDRYLIDSTELVQKIAVLLGGRAAEQQLFDAVSTGAADDLVKATEIARAMVTQYGMGGDKLGLATFERIRSPFLPAGMPEPSENFSEKTAEEIDHEVKEILDHAFVMARDAVRTHRGFVEAGAARLLQIETLDENQLRELWEGQTGRPIPPAQAPDRKPETGTTEVVGPSTPGGAPDVIREPVPQLTSPTS